MAIMFTGLVETQASIAALSPEGPGIRLTLESAEIALSARLGDSISVSGCCLTVVAIEDARLVFEAGAETLSRTTLGQKKVGDLVNLERSLQLGDRLGGHLVTGHIDATARLSRRIDDEKWSTIWFEVPANISRQLASKGSVAIDGVSLTLVDVTEDQFSVALIPHTLAVTTLGKLTTGDHVNIETDLLAKYVQRQLEAFVDR